MYQSSHICRGCLANDREMTKVISFALIYKHLTGISITPTDGLPEFVCTECSALLHKYNIFRKQLLRSHDMLCRRLLDSVSQQDLTSKVDDDDTDAPVLIKQESIEIVEEPLHRGYYQFKAKKDETPQIQLASSLMISDPLDINIVVTVKREEQAEEGEASSQEPHVGTEAAQQHLHKHVGASRTSGLDKVRQHPATTSTRHCDDAEEEVQHMMRRDGSVNNSSHSNVQSYICDKCNKCFSYKKWLIKHIIRKHKSFKCDVCMKCFTIKHNLDVHIRSHSGQTPYKCDICMKCFTHKGNLKRHVIMHTSQKQFKCDVCMKRFNRKCNLDLHARTIHSKTRKRPYKCDVCMKSFYRKHNLDGHFRIHTGEKPFKCDLCMKTFNRKGNLAVHIRKRCCERYLQ